MPRSTLGWLPYLGPKTLIWTSKAMCSSLIQKRKHRDWFLALASAIELKGDPTQSKMLSKAYVFLRDFMPRGLVEDFRHIRGDDVMEELVCHSPETTVSRHRIARHAESAWKELEQWMAVGNDWWKALEYWRQHAVAEKSRKSNTKKKVDYKAPGMHTPAGTSAPGPSQQPLPSSPLILVQASWQS